METNVQKRTRQQTLQQRVLAKQKPDSKTQQADQNIAKPPGQQPGSLWLPKGPAAGAKP